MRIKAILFFCLSLCGVTVQPLAAQAQRGEAFKSFQSGKLGKVAIGSHFNRLEKMVGPKLTLEFAGEGRGGISFEEQKDLAAIGLNAIEGIPILAVDLLYRERSGYEELESIGLSLPCDRMDLLLAKLAGADGAAKFDAKGSWRSRSEHSTKFIWFVDIKPLCRVLLRARSTKD